MSEMTVENLLKIASILSKDGKTQETDTDDSRWHIGTDTDSHWHVGKNYFIRTVTHHLVGKLIKVTDKELVLTEASWIADDGMFSVAMKTGSFDEIEPYLKDSEVIIGRGSLIDAVIFNFELPTEKK